MDGSWAKDLFRRAAQALHPDREADLRDLVAFLLNLNCLKKVLEDRRNERAAVLSDVFFEGVQF